MVLVMVLVMMPVVMLVMGRRRDVDVIV